MSIWWSDWVKAETTNLFHYAKCKTVWMEMGARAEWELENSIQNNDQLSIQEYILQEEYCEADKN